MHLIGENCMIDSSVTIGAFSVIGNNVRLEAGVRIGNNVVIHDDTIIEPDVTIHDGAILGKLPMRAVRSSTTVDDALKPCRVRCGAIIGTYAILYRSSDIGEKVLVADLATIREHVVIGEQTIIGRGVAVENRSRIGKRCKVETNSYITALSSVDNDVFIAPCVVTTNDNFLGRTEERFKHFRGPNIESHARIGANATVLPNRTVGHDSLVAAGSVVTKDVPPLAVVVGVPGRVVREVQRSHRAALDRDVP